MQITKLFAIVFISFPLFSHNYYDYIYTLPDAEEMYQVESERDFLVKKQQAYQNVVFQGLKLISLPILAYTAYRYISSQVQTNTPQAQEEGASGHYLALGAFGFFLSNFFSGMIQQTLAPYTYDLQEGICGFIGSMHNLVLGSHRDVVQELELEYIRTRNKRPIKTQKVIESSFLQMRQDFNPSSFRGIGTHKELINLRIIKQLLLLPTEVKPIVCDSNRFNAEFFEYQDMGYETTLEELKQFCNSMALASQHSNPKLKSALYFLGPPGVGKTEAAIKMGKVLNLPVIKINLAEIQNIGQLKGIYCEYPEDTRCTAGFLANALANLKKEGYDSKSVLLFFDEADTVLNRITEGQDHELVSFMKDLIEGRVKSVYNPYFETDIDIQHWGFLSAGNYPLKSDALNSRQSIILFGNYTQEYRIQAGRDKFLLDTLKDYEDTLKLEDFTEADLEQIDQIAILEHQKFLRTKEDPGFRRQIREIERFVHKKAQNSPSKRSSSN